MNKINVRSLATLFFLGSFFVSEVTIGGSSSLKIPTNELEVVFTLGVGVIVLLFSNHSYNCYYKLVFITVSIAIIQCFYFLFFNLHPVESSFGNYFVSATRLYVYISVIAIYSLFLYEEEAVVRWFYRLGVGSMVVGLTALVAHYLAGNRLLIDISYGSARPQALFTEPSAWAPVIGAVGIISWKRESYLIFALTIVMVVLSNSPTVILVTMLSFIGVFLLERGGVKTVLLGFGSVVIAGVLFVALGGLDWLVNAGVGGKTVERLALGLKFAFTLAEEGYNPRVSGAIDVVTNLSKHDLLWTGYGLNSSTVYFQAITPAGEPHARAYSILLTALFSFGIVGAVLVTYWGAKVASRLKKINSPYLYIYVPFLLVSMINSAQGFVTYKFVILGLIVYLGMGRYRR